MSLLLSVVLWALLPELKGMNEWMNYRRGHAPNRLYLESSLSVTFMHSDYCARNPDRTVLYEVYHHVMKRLNISFSEPAADLEYISSWICYPASGSTRYFKKSSGQSHAFMWLLDVNKFMSTGEAMYSTVNERCSQSMDGIVSCSRCINNSLIICK